MAHSVSCIRATKFIFDVHVRNDSPDTASYKFVNRGHSQGHVTLFLGAIANSSRTAKATDCKVGTQVKIHFCKKIHLSEICTVTSALYSIVLYCFIGLCNTYLDSVVINLGNLNTKCAITQLLL